MNAVKSTMQIVIDLIYMNIVYTIVHINFSSTFYIYTLTSEVFRKDLKELLFHNGLANKWFGVRQDTQTGTRQNTY